MITHRPSLFREGLVLLLFTIHAAVLLQEFDIINDSDDLVSNLIKRMQEAAEEDNLANKARQAATKKLVLLPTVMKTMLK